MGACIEFQFCDTILGMALCLSFSICKGKMLGEMIFKPPSSSDNVHFPLSLVQGLVEVLGINLLNEGRGAVCLCVLWGTLVITIDTVGSRPISYQVLS